MITVYPRLLAFSFPFPGSSYSSSDAVVFPHASPMHHIKERKVVCVFVRAYFQVAPHAVCVISCLYMFQTSLATAEQRRDT